MPYRLLVADDSPLYRLRLSQILAASDCLQLVGLAGDGREAIRLLKERRAEVLVLDLEMPELDGFSVLRWVIRNAPLPVVVCSGRSERDSVFQALEAGAVDFITKPELRYAIRSEAFAQELRQRVEAAAAAHAHVAGARHDQDASSLVAAARFAQNSTPRARLIGIVGSAGGPAAVTKIIAELRPEIRTPVVIALHMPEGFTRSFAERLSQTTPFAVREASDGELIAPSHIFIAPGGHHTTIIKDPQGSFRFRVEPSLADDFCAPSADRLLTSLATACGAGALGVILTGMGEDGLRGARSVREQGGLVIVESRASAVIWGMPRAVAEAGLADTELNLSAISAALPLLCERA